MKPLTFCHRFSNGQEVKLGVKRGKNGKLRFNSSEKSSFSGIEDEYLAWIATIGEIVYEVSDEGERELDFLEGLRRAAGL